LAQAVLWEFTEADLGLTFGQPQIGQISSSSPTSMKFAVFFGNGYNSPANTAALFAINPEDGQLIRKIDLCAAVPGTCDPTQPQGLSPVALAQDSGLQGQPITQVYAGDLQGNLWAIDVENANQALWSARLIFKARSPDASPQPITTAPQVTLNPSYPRFQGVFVMFGTGQLLTSSDLTSLQTQTVYGVWDKPGLSSVLDRLNLQIQTLSIVSPNVSGFSQDIIMSTTNAVGWNSKYGWYSDLPIPGQRIITDPQLINGSFITTLNTPPATLCGVASSMFLDIYYKTGGAYPNVQLDMNGDNIIDANDQYNGGNPVGVVLTPGYASSPTSVGINQNNHMVQLITMSGGQQISVINLNNSTRQTGWWQIQ
jgi:type IV pilus assembly protein PilY1